VFIKKMPAIMLAFLFTQLESITMHLSVIVDWQLSR